ncbi:hypothetical protein [Faecalispora sporosphaeroides]|uniref:Uncharacterized protein n=1 Tax=Faecalispora sporosphaeroides TaxID=1549 RepID=A0A928KXY7_9FIRM|nr:hypothetical protein [Faecalispora sporosphaeroides]MBE6833457.1 hypothetical protein [Faecalispora sporosphaeroides]
MQKNAAAGFANASAAFHRILFFVSNLIYIIFSKVSIGAGLACTRNCGADCKNHFLKTQRRFGLSLQKNPALGHANPSAGFEVLLDCGESFL